VAMTRRTLWMSGALAALTCGCGASAVQSTQAVAASQAEIRAAEAVGAEREPVAALHLKLAREQFAAGQKLLEEGEKHRADFMLARASSDAELASALSRQVGIKMQAQRALEQIRNLEAQPQ
jgi:hypothetical protein